MKKRDKYILLVSPCNKRADVWLGRELDLRKRQEEDDGGAREGVLPGFITFLPLCFSASSTPSPSMNCTVPDFSEPRSTNYSGVMQVKGRTRAACGAEQSSRCMFSPSLLCFELWSLVGVDDYEDYETKRQRMVEAWHISRGSLRLVPSNQFHKKPP